MLIQWSRHLSRNWFPATVLNQLEMTAIGCTRQSEARRKGLWGILTNSKDRVVEFDVGLDGRIPQPGYIIALADELLARTGQRRADQRSE